MSRRTHGLSKTPEYSEWCKMVRRVEDPKHPSHKWYIGVPIDPEWRSRPEVFIEWILTNLGPRPSPKHSLDRIVNALGYAPGNVRWADIKTQNDNRRMSRHVTYKGETKTITDWARSVGMHEDSLFYRIDVRGMDFERAISEPLQKRKFK